MSPDGSSTRTSTAYGDPAAAPQLEEALRRQGVYIGAFDENTMLAVTHLDVTEDMVGHKLGEFAQTRTYRGHVADKKVR